MNQIPNIEDEFENYIYHLYQQYFSLEEKGLVPTTTHCVTDSVNFEEIVVKHKEILHHQLQKARQDWLREEVVRLEKLQAPRNNDPYSNEYEHGYDRAIFDIIDCYHSELDQDNK